MTRLEIATIVENISNVQQQRTLVNSSIQIALNRVFQYHDFPYYIQDKGVIKTANDYSTGTVAMTNGLTTVAGTLTVWTSAMAGRKIRFGNDTAFYRIKSITDGTNLVLEQPYQGTTDIDATYEIYQDEYRLSPDVDKYKILRQAQNGVTLFSYHPTAFDEINPMPNSYGDPIGEIMEGTLLDTYSTGTLSGTANTSILTGSGTSWTSVEGLDRMSNIRVGSNVYTVKRVDSDTQITIYENITTNISANTSYEITLNNLRLQLYQIPNAQRLIYYRHFRQPELLANDYDIPDMPHSFHWILIYGSLSMVLMQKGDINKAQQEAEARFIDGLNMMKLKLGSFAPDRIYGRKSIDRIRNNRGIIDGREPSSFDIRYSG